MATIRTSIELQDNFTDVLNSIISTVNMGLSAMEELNRSMNSPIDTASFDAAREAANQAAIAIQEMEAAKQNTDTPATGTPAPIHLPVLPDVPDPLVDNPLPVHVPVEWQSDNLEIFTGTGMERFRQEVQSANSMLNALNGTQERIAATAAQTDLFPASAVSDMSNMQTRLASIQQRILAIESNPLNMGSDTVNAEFERLREQLNQAVQEQEAMNRAVENMDVEAANQAYFRLSHTVGNTERYIRDNTDEQGRFNRAISNGAEQANNLIQMIKSAVTAYATVQTAQKALDLSDQLTSTTARLNLMNDGLQTTQDLQNMIFRSAERSRGSYQQTADTVSKLGLMAGDAFSSSEEIIAFAEQLNKQFTIAGTNTTGIDAAMLQLTQAMGSGVLRGEEYNSILEQAPNIIQAIADYLDVPKGQLKDMAAEGQITAEIVKNAIFAAADETNAKFKRMPKTFSQIWTSFENNAMMAFQPVLERLNDLANSEAFQTFVSNAAAVLSVVAGIALGIFDLAVRIGSVIADNWTWVEPVILGIVGALVAYHSWLLLVKTAEIASKTAKGLMAIATTGLTGATVAQTAAQEGLNTAMYAFPVMWIIALIMLLIAALILLWDHCERFREFCSDMWRESADSALWIQNNIIVPMANTLMEAHEKVMGVVLKCVRACINAYYDLAAGISDGIATVMEKMSGLVDFYNQITSALGGPTVSVEMFETNTERLEKEREAVLAMLDAYEDAAGHMTRYQLKEWDEDAFGAAADDMAENIKNFTVTGWLKEQWQAIQGELAFDKEGDDTWEYDFPLEDALNDIEDTLDDIKDGMDITEEDLKYLRDIAEQEAINRYTTAEITIEQTNHNNLSGKMDLDGVVSGLTDAVNEAVDIITEGVHA